MVLLSYGEQVDSGAFPQRLRTDRSVDGGRTFTQLVTDVLINATTQLADGSLVALDFRTDELVGTAPPGFVVLPAGTPLVSVASGGVGLSSARAVRLNDTSSRAMNGRLFSRVPLTPGTTSFTGIEVSSGGTIPVGDDTFIDQFRAS